MNQPIRLFTDPTERILRLGVYISIITMIAVGVSVVAFALNSMKNSNRLVESQIEQNKKITEQIGKPQVVEQRYMYNYGKEDAK